MTPPTPEHVAELIAELTAWSVALKERHSTYTLAERADEAIATLSALHADNARLREALTPSGDTKAAYMGDFAWEEELEDGCGVAMRIVPWTTIKEIMKAIADRAALTTPPAKEADRG